MGEIQSMLEYQAVDHCTLTPVDSKIFKARKDMDPDQPGLIEALISPHSEQWNKYMTEEITNLVK